MSAVTLSIVHVCDSCLGPYLVASGVCADCGATGYHYSYQDRPPEWLWLMPILPLTVGARIRHRLDLTLGYVRSMRTRHDGEPVIEVLWDNGNKLPSVCETRTDLVRLDLEDPSGGSYGLALRWAWRNTSELPLEVSLERLGALVAAHTAGRAPTPDDIHALAEYCDQIDLWRGR